MTAVHTRSVEPFLAAYRAARRSLPGGADDLRAVAIARFAELGLPTRRVEDWRYTDLRRLGSLDSARLGGAGEVDGDYADEALGSGPPGAIAALDAHCIVLIDGRCGSDASTLASLPAALSTLSLRLGAENRAPVPALDREMAGHAGLRALNTAMTRDGLVVDLPPGARLDKPVCVIHRRSRAHGGLAVHPRSLLRIGAGCELELIEVFAGDPDADGWTNAILDAELAEGARLRHLVLVAEPERAIHTGLSEITLGADAVYRGFVLTVGGGTARTETRVRLEGGGASCALSGGALVGGRRHADHTIEITHAVPRTDSSQVFRNVVDDRGRAVFQGRVVVEADAQKTDARQSCRNLLLSPSAEANNKPELRIFADDVKCTHGATVGDLDRDAMFYLRARGIGDTEARALLTRAFISELFDLVPVASARPVVEDAVAEWLVRG